jgi:membrane protease YdiL (CAAX protease family)
MTSQEKEPKKVFTHLFVMVRLLAVYFVVYFGLVYGLSVSKKMEGKAGYITVIACLFAGLITILWLPKDQKSFKVKGAALSVPGILLLSFGLTVILNYLFTVIPWESFLPERMLYSDGNLFEMPLWFAILGYGVIAPFAEEVCFRGVVFGSLRKMMKAPFAILISALLFALYHANLIQGLYAFIMGILLAVVADQTESLAGSILFHMTANLIVTAYSYNEDLMKFLSSVPGLCICGAVALTGVILLTVSFKKKSKSVQK